MRITVLRLGHRKKRDVRMTTHCGLVARAFFADEFILSGELDGTPLNTLASVGKNWGGKLKARHEQNWRQFLMKRKRKKEIIVHLTMYGVPALEILPQLRLLSKKHRLIVVVGSEKMPPEIYKLADFNIAITSQPHSEVAALAIFLNEIQNGVPLSRSAQRHFGKAKNIIRPGAKGRNNSAFGCRKQQ
ncbi:MAG: tRNA (cytidine(56)-2'-O)-methyltransferase [Candidatus Micrarchaeota archaeon]